MAEPFLGEIRMVGFNFPPRGWAECNGQILTIASNSALFSLFGTIYGGDGRTTFGLPELRGRVPIHQGQGPGLANYTIGQKSGTESVTLGVNNLPSHNHTATVEAYSGRGNNNTPAPNRVPAELVRELAYSDEMPDTTLSPETIVVDNTGGGEAIYNLQPFQVINFVVATVGLFPSRS